MVDGVELDGSIATVHAQISLFSLESQAASEQWGLRRILFTVSVSTDILKHYSNQSGLTSGRKEGRLWRKQERGCQAEIQKRTGAANNELL